MKAVFIAMMTIIFITFLFAQNQNDKLLLNIKEKAQKQIYSLDEAEIMNLKSLCERYLSVEPENDYARYYSALADYALIIKLFQNPDKDKFLSLYSSLNSKCDQIKKSELLAEVKVLKAYANMMKINVTPNEAPILSGSIYALVGTALELDDDNPRAQLIQAVMLFKIPKQYGGNPDKALTMLENAGIFFANENNNTFLPDWGYEEALAWLGQIQLSMGEKEIAKSTFEKALEINPDYGWVKYVLLPEINKNEMELK